ncbi:hypothetical protein [Lutispora sp.]|uniref:hypothetical protein n=1 Tax=Lutispora sp. TaxID=2828727 RepID=UPI003567F0F9
MKTEITKYNYEKVIDLLNDIAAGSNYATKNANFYGVTSITAELGHNFNSDPELEAGYDGGGEDYICIKFNFEGGGEACISFRPDEEHCEVTKEMDDLWIFHIEPIPDYVAREKDMLDYKLKEYEEYMKS